MKTKERFNEKKLITDVFENLGFSVIHFNNYKNANGVDLWVQRPGHRPLSVEIKKVRKYIDGSSQVDAVSKPRRKDDIIAIIFNKKYVLIEPMKDHLRNCSKIKGTRQFTILTNDLKLEEVVKLLRD